jgi:hypothetical protein
LAENGLDAIHLCKGKGEGLEDDGVDDIMGGRHGCVKQGTKAQVCFTGDESVWKLRKFNGVRSDSRDR